MAYISGGHYPRRGPNENLPIAQWRVTGVDEARSNVETRSRIIIPTRKSAVVIPGEEKIGPAYWGIKPLPLVQRKIGVKPDVD